MLTPPALSHHDTARSSQDMFLFRLLALPLLVSAVAIQTRTQPQRGPSPTITTTICPTSSTISPNLDLRVREQVALTTVAVDDIDSFTTTILNIIPGKTDSYVTIHPQTIAIAIPTCHQTITPDHNGYVPPGTCGAIWTYYPAFKAAVAFAVIFALLLGVHLWQAIIYKKKWCWVIIMASIWETMAFSFRAIRTRDQQSEGIYLCFQIFILLAPLWVNAFAYMTFGRIVYAFHPSKSVLGIPAVTLAAIFVFLDIVSFVIQLIGGGMASPTASAAAQQRALQIYMGGIGFQQCIIVIFLVLCMRFQWQMDQAALYVALCMITVRIIYRFSEFSSGITKGNALTKYEAYFYLLEATPMMFAILVFNLLHPGRFVRENMQGIWSVFCGKIRNRRGKTTVEGYDGDAYDLDRHKLVEGCNAL
ncbi:RTA1 like protein domain-containing protein [Trichoderma breve]|uniref:RTA1 like protein domain-containing protein n=1 Tax=Trichoderma breve TaxID=2034170 RepID=A0A9W9BDN7_9HYPO|nr:RTA1 like protein domain-containing protein [Trichoderma breve]KAJ4858028.1 RTA1 like protein domain-containing protein [Trichoderma breve]